MSNSNIFFNVDTQQDFFNREGVDIPNNESILENLSLISEFLKKHNLKTIHSEEKKYYASYFPKNNNRIKMKKTDLTQLDGMYYVGHLIDMDGSGYVDEETAELILLEYNNGVTE